MLQGNAGSMNWKYFALLSLSLAVYLVAGAFIFRATESSYELESRQQLQYAYEAFLGKVDTRGRNRHLSHTPSVNTALILSGQHSSHTPSVNTGLILPVLTQVSYSQC